MKKLNITFLLTVLMSMVGANGFAYDIAVSNADGVTIYYDWINNETELEVVKGPYKDGLVDIPNSVTYNGKKYSVTSIGEGAFSYSSSLQYIIIPNSVTSIGAEAFRSCRELYSVKIPNFVTSIGKLAFAGCGSLTLVEIPNSVTSIGRSAFNGTAWYSRQPDGLVYAGKVVYQYKGTMPQNTSISLKEGTLGIAESAFSNCSSLTSMTISNSVKTIGKDAFSSCSNLKSVIIGNGVTSIGEWAFSYCRALTSVTIPNSVKTIGEYAFNYCSGLISVIIPNSVKSISFSTFYNCSSLSSVTIPNSVTTIGNRAFHGCSSLSSVTIPNSVTSIGEGAFSACSVLTSVTIPNSVMSIGGSAFIACSSLSSVVIPNSVTSISGSAFRNCNSLSSVTIPNSVTSIGDEAFRYCNSLKTLKLPDNIEKIYSSAFDSSCKLLCKEGSITLISLWEAPAKAYSLEGKELPRPTVSSSNTQTTVTLNIDNYYKQYNYSSNHSIKDGQITLKDLFPEESVYTMIEMSTTDGKKKLKLTEGSYMTKSISPNIKFEVSPTSIKPMGTYTSGDASVTSKKMYFGNNLMETNSMELTGLNPKASYGFRYEIVVTSAKGTTRTYQATKYIETSALSLKTLQPKVISSGNVIVAAETNINVDEEKVGFEWRRTDWTSDFPSNTGAAALFDGTMEGYIRNLNTDKLWKVRPYYLSNSGTYYYGDWMGVDPTNTSYFEPTVHTYAKIEVKGNTALIKGYALQGTDGVKVQGFKYWRRVSKASAEDSDKAMAKRAPNIPSNATTVTSSGQVMTAELANLGYETNYSFVAFVTTNTGETFYGEEQTFTTGATPVGIEGVEISAEEKRLNNAPKYYDMQGHQLNGPIRGLNIVRMADGTVKKVLVK